MIYEIDSLAMSEVNALNLKEIQGNVDSNYDSVAEGLSVWDGSKNWEPTLMNQSIFNSKTRRKCFFVIKEPFQEAMQEEEGQELRKCQRSRKCCNCGWWL